MKTLAEMMEFVEQRCTRDDNGCLVWRYSCRDGVPQANWKTEDGKKTTLNVRRALWESLKGKKPRKSYVIVCTCGTDFCVEPKHLKEISRSQLQSGKPKSEAHRLAIAKAARNKKNTKLSPEAVKEIRESDERVIVLAKRFGVTVSHVYGIKANRWCRDTDGNPFAQLFARISASKPAKASLRKVEFAQLAAALGTA
jgi:hypothetical protein